jgi:integral membrane sensor domain MASE1
MHEAHALCLMCLRNWPCFTILYKLSNLLYSELVIVQSQLLLWLNIILSALCVNLVANFFTTVAHDGSKYPCRTQYIRIGPEDLVKNQ